MSITVQHVRSAFDQIGTRPFDTGQFEPPCSPSESRKNAANSQAAVALVIRAASCSELEQTNPRSAEILLIQRATHPKDPWSGHMAFPGGRRDSTDATLLETAYREVSEEVGVSLLRDGEPLGALSSLPAVARGRRTGLTIAPFVFLLRRHAELRLDAREVQAAHWAPLAPLLSGDRDTYHLYRDGSLTHRMPGFDVEGKTVWGLTHAMLKQLLDQLRR